MKNLNLFILLFSIAIATTCCAQPAFVQKVQAYTATKKIGRLPVNLEGMEVTPQPQTFTTVYVETKGARPTWLSATINNQLYNVVASGIKSPEFIGTNKISNQKVVIQSKPGNQLWQLELEPKNGKVAKAISSKDKIIIKGKNQNKHFEIKVKKVTELELPDAS